MKKSSKGQLNIFSSKKPKRSRRPRVSRPAKPARMFSTGSSRRPKLFGGSGRKPKLSGGGRGLSFRPTGGMVDAIFLLVFDIIWIIITFTHLIKFIPTPWTFNGAAKACLTLALVLVNVLFITDSGEGRRSIIPDGVRSILGIAVAALLVVGFGMAIIL